MLGLQKLYLIVIIANVNAVGPEIGWQNLGMFGVEPLTTHHLIRRRNGNTSNNSYSILDMGVYGWSPVRINDSLKYFDQTNHESQDSIWRCSRILRGLVDNYNDVGAVKIAYDECKAFVISKTHVKENQNYQWITFDQFHSALKSLRGLELLMSIDLYRLNVALRNRGDRTLFEMNSFDDISSKLNVWRKTPGNI